MTGSKPQIRRQMRTRRRALSERERADCARRLVRATASDILLRRARRFACYLPNDGEMDLTPLMARLWALGRWSYLPVIRGPRLWFLRYQPGTPLAANRFGIPEPDLAPTKRCAPFALDIVLMPLVAFDDAGNRLGMGGGYYDQTFAYKSRRRAWRKPLLLGVAYEFQRISSLPTHPWDVALDGIVTEEGFQKFG